VCVGDLDNLLLLRISYSFCYFSSNSTFPRKFALAVETQAQSNHNVQKQNGLNLRSIAALDE